MKVSELIKLLKEVPMDYEVLLSSDEEGNRYTPMSEYLGECVYKDGEVSDVKLNETNAIILYPGGSW